VREEKDAADLEQEWLDRYGPLPGEAEALLSIGRLRVACLRAGVTEVTGVPVRPGTPGSPGKPGEVVVRLSPLSLPISSQVRLSRLAPGAIWKEDARQLILPVRSGRDLADRLAGFLSELLPALPAA
jgi:transcription-repair coupling factor (superfamily II helicase)